MIANVSKDNYQIQQIINPCTATTLNTQLDIKNVSISVFDLNGMKLLESNNGQINIAQLKNGIYIIKAIINNEESLTIKIIK